MTPGQKAVAAGALAAIPVLGIGLYFKVGNLTSQAAVVQASLTAEARRQVELVAEDAVKGYLADVYGVTQPRMASITRLSQQFGRFL